MRCDATGEDHGAPSTLMEQEKPKKCKAMRKCFIKSVQGTHGGSKLWHSYEFFHLCCITGHMTVVPDLKRRRMRRGSRAANCNMYDIQGCMQDLQMSRTYVFFFYSRLSREIFLGSKLDILELREPVSQTSTTAFCSPH